MPGLIMPGPIIFGIVSGIRLKEICSHIDGDSSREPSPSAQQLSTFNFQLTLPTANKWYKSCSFLNDPFLKRFVLIIISTGTVGFGCRQEMDLNENIGAENVEGLQRVAGMYDNTLTQMPFEDELSGRGCVSRCIISARQTLLRKRPGLDQNRRCREQIATGKNRAAGTEQVILCAALNSIFSSYVGE